MLVGFHGLWWLLRGSSAPKHVLGRRRAAQLRKRRGALWRGDDGLDRPFQSIAYWHSLKVQARQRVSAVCQGEGTVCCRLPLERDSKSESVHEAEMHIS